MIKNIGTVIHILDFSVTKSKGLTSSTLTESTILIGSVTRDKPGVQIIFGLLDESTVILSVGLNDILTGIYCSFNVEGGNPIALESLLPHTNAWSAKY